MRHDASALRWAAPLAALTALLLYLTTLSAHFTADGLLYALAVEAGPGPYFVEPTHLALHPLAWLWVQGWRWLGWSGRAIGPLQALNALGGALAVGLLVAITARLLQRWRLALLAALGFAVSGGAWLLSVEAEFVTVPLAAALGVIWLAGAAPPANWRRRYAVTLGFLTVMAGLFFATNLLLAPALLLYLWSDNRPGRPALRAYLVGLAVGVFAAAAALLLALTAANGATLPALDAGGYAQTGLSDLPQGIYAFLRSLILFRGLAMNDSTGAFWAAADGATRLVFVATYLIAAGLAALPLAYGWRHRRKLGLTRAGLPAALLLWALLQALFAWFWVPGDVSFWLPVLAVWWIVAAMVMDRRIGRARSATGRRWLAQATLLILMLGLLNYGMLIEPRRDPASSQPIQLAGQVAARTEADAVLLVAPDDTTALYVAYFAPRRLVAAPVHESDELRQLAATLTPGRAVYVVRGGQLLPLTSGSDRP
ncbi:MAG: hypothetical protein R3300_05365 [Candidatus Promineifilaceae bacterium]|nr:hypothetical protein [Candidatus Promineifilaceae bacterium]